MSIVPGAVDDGLQERPRLGAILLRKGWLSPEQLEAALTMTAGGTERLGEVLVRLGWATEESIAKALAEQFGLAFMDPYSADPDPAAVKRLPADVAARRCVLPLRFLDPSTVVVAVADPTDDEGLAEVRQAMGCQLSLAVAERSAIEYAQMHAGKPKRARDLLPPPEREPESKATTHAAPTDDLATTVSQLVVAVRQIAVELKLLRETIAPAVSPAPGVEPLRVPDFVPLDRPARGETP